MREFDSIDAARQDFSRSKEEIQSYFEWLLDAGRPYAVRNKYAPQLEEVVSAVQDLEFPREISRKKNGQLIDLITKIHTQFASLVDDLEYLRDYKGAIEDLREFTEETLADSVSLLSSDLGTWVEELEKEDEENPVVLVIQDNLDRIKHAFKKQQDAKSDQNFSKHQTEIKNSIESISKFAEALGDFSENILLRYLATIVTNIRSKAVHMHIQNLRNALLIPELLGHYFESLEESERTRANEAFELTDSMMNLKKELPMMSVQALDIIDSHGTTQSFGMVPNQKCAKKFFSWLHQVSGAMHTRLTEKNRLLLDTKDPDVYTTMFLKGLLVGALLDYTTLADEKGIDNELTEEHRKVTEEIVTQVEALENTDPTEGLNQDLLKSATGVDPQLALHHLEKQLKYLIGLIERMISISPAAKDVIFEFLSSSYGLKLSRADSVKDVVGRLKNTLTASGS